jgi:hypothetical protein
MEFKRGLTGSESAASGGFKRAHYCWHRKCELGIMAHYAFLDENNVVTEVITGIDETELIEGLDTETWYGNFRGQTCKRTSYNGNIRKQYAGHWL